MKNFGSLLVLGILVAACAAPPEREPDPVAVARADPRYPPAAVRDGIEGHVTLGFNIAYNGKPRNIHVVDADPPGVFEDAAIQAMELWRFDANRENRYAFEDEFTQTFEFEIDENAPAFSDDPAPQPVRRVEPRYPRHAYLNAISGYVVVDFRLDADGGVRNVQVVDSSPEGVFDEAALEGHRGEVAVGGSHGADFDPQLIQDVDWGSLELVFDDTNTGQLSYESDLDRFGSGEYPISRLTQPLLPDCSN